MRSSEVLSFNPFGLAIFLNLGKGIAENHGLCHVFFGVDPFRDEPRHGAGADGSRGRSFLCVYIKL